MQNLFYNISQVLGATILHSLWQGFLIYLLLRLITLILPSLSALNNYRLSYLALCLLLGWFGITLFTQLNNYQWLSVTAVQVKPLVFPVLAQQVIKPVNQLYFTVASCMPWLALFYTAGLVFNILKLMLAFNNVRISRQNTIDAGFESTIISLCAKLQLTKPVAALFSQHIDIPCVTGLIKPVILLPVAITCHLSISEVEAILLHELAHVKRNDYLFNIIQQIIGVLLFFNPFAWLLEKMINRERENCCDDMVVQSSGSQLVYAQALLKLEENKLQQWQLALAAKTTEYELLNRIDRIMKNKQQTVNRRAVAITVMALTCAVSSIAWLNPEMKNGRIIIKNAPAIHKIAVAFTGAPAVSDSGVAKLSRKHKPHLIFKFDTDMRTANGIPDTAINGKKYKIVVEDEAGIKREYSSYNDLPEKDKNSFIGKAADLQFRLDSNQTIKYDNFYQNGDWQKQIAEAQKLGASIAKQFNTPEWQKQQKELVEKSLDMAKQFNAPAFKKQQKELLRQSLEMAEIANRPEMQKMIADMVKNYANPEFKAKMEDMAKYHDSPEFKNKIESMTQYYDSPEFRVSIDKMTKYYDGPEFKANIDKMTKYYDGPAFKKKLKAMTKYYDNPKTKKKWAEMEKSMEKNIQKDVDKNLREGGVLKQDSIK